MSLTSPQFLIFLACVSGLGFFVTGAARKYLLVVSSLVFIAAFNWLSLIAVVFLASLNFLFGKWLPSQSNRLLFRFSVLLNCMAIVLNNYFLAVHGKIEFSFGSTWFMTGNLLLIVGLSFYSLQHIAYLVDIQLKKILPEIHYINFLLASVYFPKFISGPVTNYRQIRSQLPVIKPSSPMLWQGINRMLLGFFKKMVIADRLAPSVSSVFDYGDTLPGVTILIAAIFFTIQLYFDFSGYCDIALGASKLLGIELPENFNFPLRATSVTVFWRRWHQSLIAFFTEYIFYPVSFRYRRFKKQAVAIAIAVTFLISGLWHGIGFTFVAWSFCHLLYLLAELYLQKNAGLRQERSNKFVKVIYASAVLLLVSFSHIFFRASSTANALHLLSGLFRLPGFFPDSWTVQVIAPLAVGGRQADQFNLVLTVFFMSLTLLCERKIFAWANSTAFRPWMTFLMLLLVFMLGVFGSAQRFIYMQF
jgi:alginate O-acetyltransferase complex protein AlgI